MRRVVSVVLLTLAISAPAFAQTPNRLDVVQRVAANEGKAALQACKSTDHDPNCGQFTRLVACALAGEGFGLLTKQPSENQSNGFAVDAIIYKNNQVIDLLSGGLGLQWIEVVKRAGNEFAAPVGCGGGDPQPPPPSDFVTQAEMRAAFEALSARLAKLEAGSGGSTPPADGETLAVLREQLAVTKQILELLKKTASKFGVQ